MKTTFRLSMHAGVARAAILGLLSACCLGVAVSANAATNDPDYYNLYPTDLGPDGMKGEGTTIDVCGISGCNSDYDMIVSTISITPAGSGVRDTFLRVQAPGNGTIETAYNTDLYPLQDDSDYRNGAKDTTAGNKDSFNNAVLISDLLMVSSSGEAWQDGDGIAYYQILLDVNENGADNEFLRLDEFELHTSATGLVGEFAGFDNPDPLNNGSFAIDGTSGTGTKVFDMDYWQTESNPNDRYGGMILSSLQDGTGRNGSGDEDYSFLIPVSLVDNGDNYLHVAATFGCEVIGGNSNKAQCQDFDDNDPLARAQAGFEEFAAVLGPNPEGDFDLPVPGTALLLGMGLMLLRRRQRVAT